jgi:hypothetical protein
VSTDVPHKPYFLEHEIRSEYLYVYVKCDVLNYDIAKAYWDEIIDIVATTQSTRMLVEKDIYAEMTSTDIHRIGSEITRSALRQVKIAVYDPLTSQRTRQFSETVWLNRDLNGRVFDDFSAAEKWLVSVV